MDGEPIKSGEGRSGATKATAPAGMLPFDPPDDSPRQEEISRITGAMLRGDFGESRRAARQLLAQIGIGDVERAFAQQILKRTDVDPVALAVGLSSFVLFFVILYFTLWR
jgi:hypothetical protein